MDYSLAGVGQKDIRGVLPAERRLLLNKRRLKTEYPVAGTTTAAGKLRAAILNIYGGQEGNLRTGYTGKQNYFCEVTYSA